MIQRVEPTEIIGKLSEHKKFMWICHLKNSGFLTIRPTWDPSPSGAESEVMLVHDQFPNLIIFESYINDAYDQVKEFGVIESDIIYRNKLRPIMMTFKNGWINKTSGSNCYCTETFVDLIIDLHPEFLDTLSI